MIDLGKFLPWILKERKLLPLENVTLGDCKGNIQRKIKNIYECPYCHKEIEFLTNATAKLARKCRFCNHNVSPFKGNVDDTIWLPEGVDVLPDDFGKE